ncbi:MAG TPA: gfo/Idh/MocA family oxidoreductase, partial [Pirellulales bacterium]|nr:gfo/Idh/MocA family oxidoreductase [Pirellulales bacterium]
FSMELDMSQAQLIKERVERAGVAFMAEFPRRQSPATLRLKELIATRLGNPRLLFCHSRVPVEQHGSAASAKSSIHSSPTSDLIELVDWCTYVVGRPPTSVLGMRHKAAGDVLEDDYQMMSLDFSGPGEPGTSATAQISCGRYMQSSWHEALAFRPPAALQVACEKGIAFIDLPSTLIWFDSFGRHQESLESERPVGEQLLSQFHRAVTSLVRNTSSLEDSYRALAVVLQARASHAQGKRMPLGS